MTNTVVTYYSSVPALYDEASQQNLIRIWERSWRKAGWTAVVLTEADVRSYSRFKFFAEQFNSKPTEYGSLYSNAVFLRWLAAAHYGFLRGVDVMLTDYDVVNYGFAPRAINPGKMIIFCDEPPKTIFMGAVLGSAQHFLDMAELFVAASPGQHDWNAHAGMYHQDDLSLLVRMFESKTLPKPDWLIKENGCALFDNPSWPTARLVHYGYKMHDLGLWPKHKHIDNLRPL